MKARRADIGGTDAPVEERRQSPPERKVLDYARHRRGFSEHRHSLRHGKWRKKRRVAQKPERQGAAQILRGLVGRVGGSDEADILLPVRRRISKWGAARLRDWVSGQLERRADAFAWNMLKKPYDAAAHQLAFAAALRALTGGTSSVVPIAERFDFLLRLMDAVGPVHDPRWYRNGRQVEWLRRFFRDEPAWEQRLRAWVDERMRRRDSLDDEEALARRSIDDILGIGASTRADDDHLALSSPEEKRPPRPLG